MLAGIGILLGSLISLVAAESTNLLDNPDKIPDLRPPRELLEPTFWDQHGALVAVALAAALLAITALAWRLSRPKPAIPVPPADAARRALAALRGRPGDAALLTEVPRVLRRYLLAALALHQDELTTDELSLLLASEQRLGPGLFSALTELLRACDTRKFAPVTPSASADVVERALELVNRIEARLHPPPAAPSAAAPASAPA